MCISALTGEGLEDLASELERQLSAQMSHQRVLVPYSMGEVCEAIPGSNAQSWPAKLVSMPSHPSQHTVLVIPRWRRAGGKRVAPVGFNSG